MPHKPPIHSHSQAIELLAGRGAVQIFRGPWATKGMTLCAIQGTFDCAIFLGTTPLIRYSSDDTCTFWNPFLAPSLIAARLSWFLPRAECLGNGQYAAIPRDCPPDSYCLSAFKTCDMLEILNYLYCAEYGESYHYFLRVDPGVSALFKPPSSLHLSKHLPSSHRIKGLRIETGEDGKPAYAYDHEQFLDDDNEAMQREAQCVTALAGLEPGRV